MPTMSRLVSLMRDSSVVSPLATGRLQGSSVIALRMDYSRLLGADLADGRPVVCSGPANFQQTENENADHDQNEYEGQRCVDVVVEHDLTHLSNVLRGREQFTFGERCAETTGVRQEADRRVAVEHLLQAGCQCTDQQPQRRRGGHPGIFLPFHLEQQDGAGDEGYT